MAVKFDKQTGEVKKSKFEFIVKRSVTIPVLSIDGGGEFVICPIEHPISKIMKNKKGKPKLNEDGSIASMKIIKVFDLDDCEVKSMVLPAVAYSNLRNDYPKGFLGLFFNIIIPREKVEGKQYKQCKVTEVFPPKGIEEALATATPPLVIAELLKLNVLTQGFWKDLEPSREQDLDVVEEE